MSSFSPQELYNQYGITSYNLGTTQQSMLVSYYWLKEALRFQSPKAIVIDVKELFPYKDDVPLNADEASIRKAMDYMKWSSVKKEAVDDICRIDETQDKISYYFPLFRFHTRWKNLKEDDFSYNAMVDRGELKGYNVLSTSAGGEFEPYEEGSSQESEEMFARMCDYMDRIVQLCEEKQIALLLVNTPYRDGSIEKHNAVKAYADQHQLPFYDFCAKKDYQAAGLNFAVDNADSKHANLWGAIKMTDYIGKILSEEYQIAARQDAQWDQTAEYFEQVKKDCELTRVTNMPQYLSMLQDDRYSVLVAVKGDVAAEIRGDVLEGFRRLGIAAPVEGAFGSSYYAVLDNYQVREEISMESLSVTGALRKGVVSYEIVSEGKESGNSCSIKIDGDKYAVGEKGWNIVVYNNEIKRVIDSVCFDTSKPEVTAVR